MNKDKLMNCSYDDILENARSMHFIGIGGSGTVPLVEILMHQGKHITGSDMDGKADSVKRLRGFGIEVMVGQRAENIRDGVDMVVYSAAISKENPELRAAVEKGIPTIERSILLGAVCRRYNRTIAVSGTHGKTTVTSMITQILMTDHLDPSVVIGGKLEFIDAYGRAGHSDLMVCEACEFVDTFLQIPPACAVILNIDNDHLEYFGCVENTITSFHQFCLQTRDLVIVNGDDANSLKATEDIKAKITTFGFSESNDYRAVNIVTDHDSHWSFDILKHNEPFCTGVKLCVPGHHNVLNALAAAAAADYAGASCNSIVDGLDSFAGAKRRFDIHTVTNGITIADDYAHHPAEIEAVLSACKEMNYRKVWAVFQPFTYSRTKMHLHEFARVLSIADEVLLTEIMAARETDDLGISSKDLQELIPGSIVFPSMEAIADYALAHAQSGDLIITMSCGDIYKCAKIMAARLKGK